MAKMLEGGYYSQQFPVSSRVVFLCTVQASAVERHWAVLPLNLLK